ncbi:uncharacterized protein [Gossypium hirsutum]|uniref:Tf2-1-like SH3-like domain-containing protein n=1 Tax=Gossypium hirsutum TaxID=3635 RepID=A0A1U8LP12_GOSHI|nr:uncharacterized protein LOC107929426 [Gossypium hirsutum]
MDFVSGLPMTLRKKDSIWVIIDRLTKLVHFILARTDYSVEKLAELNVSEIVRLHGVPLSIFLIEIRDSPSDFGEIEDKVRIIRDCLKVAPDRQKSYADLKRKDIEFVVGDQMFLKVSLWKKITERIDPVAYRLVLPSELEKIHNVFHVSMLRRYRQDPSHVVTPYEVEIQLDLSYSEEPISVLAREIKELQNKRVLLVKVLWNRHRVEEATWETEDLMRLQYPNLFTSKKFWG